MSVTRLMRKKKAKCIRKYVKNKLLKKLLWTPCYKRVDVSDIKNGVCKGK